MGRFYGNVGVTLEAIPMPGYQFSHWSGDLVGGENPVSLTIYNDSLISANFSRIMHTMTVQADGEGTTSPAVGSHAYGDGASVTITATPEEGWRFDSWDGDVDDPSATSTKVSLDSDKVVSANFSRIIRIMTVQVDGEGTTSPAIGSHAYSDGALVEITATPEEGWRFDSWTGDVINPNLCSTTVCLGSNRIITAKFSPITPNLSLIGTLVFVGVPAMIARIVLGGI